MVKTQNILLVLSKQMEKCTFFLLKTREMQGNIIKLSSCTSTPKIGMDLGFRNLLLLGLRLVHDFNLAVLLNPRVNIYQKLVEVRISSFF